MVGLIALRSLLLATLEAPEPRYTLECFPVLIVLAAVGFTGCRKNLPTKGPAGAAERHIRPN
jgi:hypothetical protein